MEKILKEFAVTVVRSIGSSMIAFHNVVTQISNPMEFQYNYTKGSMDALINNTSPTTVHEIQEDSLMKSFIIQSIQLELTNGE